MRVLAYIAAFGLVPVVGYYLITKGYDHFLLRTHSQAMAQFLTFGSLALTFMAVFWATKRIP